MPVEQEVSRLMAARRAARQAPPRLKHVAVYVVATFAVLLGIAMTSSAWVAETLFAGQRQIVWITVAALVTVGVEYFVRGTLSGFGLFVRYGTQLSIDGFSRVGVAVVVFVGPWQSATAYGIALILAPLVATVLTLSVAALRWLRSDPTPAHSGTIGPLVLTSATSQLLANSGPLAIAALATASQQGDAGRFVAAVTIGRIPLFLFAAIQAVFLPTLSGLVARSEVVEFRRTFRTAWLATIALGTVGTAGIALLGQWVMQLIYGPEFIVTLLDLTLIAVSGALFMQAQTLAQALLAHRADILVALGWAAGLVSTVAALSLPLDLTTRVASALCIGSGVAACVLLLVHVRTVAKWEQETTGRVAPP